MACFRMFTMSFITLSASVILEVCSDRILFEKVLHCSVKDEPYVAFMEASLPKCASECFKLDSCSAFSRRNDLCYLYEVYIAPASSCSSEPSTERQEFLKIQFCMNGGYWDYTQEKCICDTSHFTGDRCQDPVQSSESDSDEIDDSESDSDEIDDSESDSDEIDDSESDSDEIDD